ncbi:MAG: LapA family protein [Bacteroidetes bacterium]|nr:LapA family protein [Bacteroidota bacterium]
MSFKVLIIILLTLLVAIVSIQNTAIVDLKFFIWTLSISRILLILISFVLGLLVGLLLGVSRKNTSSTLSSSDQRDGFAK